MTGLAFACLALALAAAVPAASQLRGRAACASTRGASGRLPASPATSFGDDLGWGTGPGFSPALAALESEDIRPLGLPPAPVGGPAGFHQSPGVMRAFLI